MKKFALKSAILAIGALAAASAFATATSLDAAVTKTTFAKELVIDGTTGLALGSVDGANTLTYNATLGVTTVAQFFVRIDLSGGAKFTASPTLLIATAGAPGVSTGGAAALSSGGAGESYAVFSVAANAGNTSVKLAEVTAAGFTAFSSADAGMRVRLYETLTTAQNPNNAASLALKDTGDRVIFGFTNALAQTVVAGSAVADVAPTVGSAYTKFVTQGTLGAPLGSVTFTNTPRFVAAATGAIATGTILANTNDVVVTATGGSDFSFVATNGTTYDTAAKGRVKLSTSSTCAAGSVVSATTLTSSTATFTDVSAANLGQDLYVCALPEGTAAINAGTFAIAVDNDAASAAVTATDIATTGLSTVTRNGTTLVAPLTNQPAGWFSRLVLTNSGSSDRTYAVTAIAENGTTVSLTGNAASGTVPANKTMVIDLQTLTSTVGLSRYGVQVVVNGPASQVSGAYQLVNSATGAISNSNLIQK